MQFYNLIEIRNKQTLTEDLHRIDYRWQKFSKKLGLSQKTIDSIHSSTQSNDPCDCLKEALIAWLSGKYNQSVYGPPTLDSLCAAVANPQGGRNKVLAIRIAQKPVSLLLK